MSFARPGVQETLLRRLRRGDISVASNLDLHGMTVPAAKQAVANFLHSARAQGWRCVRIVHGKGHGSPGRQPILKYKLAGWLARSEDVLAYRSASPAGGGRGLSRNPARARHVP